MLGSSMVSTGMTRRSADSVFDAKAASASASEFSERGIFVNSNVLNALASLCVCLRYVHAIVFRVVVTAELFSDELRVAERTNVFCSDCFGETKSGNNRFVFGFVVGRWETEFDRLLENLACRGDEADADACSLPGGRSVDMQCPFEDLLVLLSCELWWDFYDEVG
ncbi:unnamed protein product [Microthlaspi erraticum]|uniref:Uncharacterized protein n=1 Tax=Microthlaspi erraticum TaxID=1685480 RepID=A0A6D2LEE4_9BRAS|nr:unnamed protein product [Microthlaspi erraticum]